jgi:hypothetical protein
VSRRCAISDGDVETYYEDGSWKNWSDGDLVGEPHQHRRAAVAEGREAASNRGVQHIVRDEDATVVERTDFSRQRESIVE